MNHPIPSPVAEIIKRFVVAKYEIYIVGGAVRDILLKRAVNDWDFTTNATPDQIRALFGDSFYDNEFGTVGVAGKYLGDAENPEEVYEITTFRSEGLYSDHRRPDQVVWGSSLDEDLQRRDFTINAMAIGIHDGAFHLYDPYEGKKDLEAKTIRAVGNPSERFGEDGLRMMRAIRFGAQLGFSIEIETLNAIQAHAGELHHISWERIRDEFLKILASSYPEQGLQLLDSTGLLATILPEFLDTRGVEQSRHHIYDVWTHTIKAVQSCPSTDPIVRLSVLLHDIGKPQTARLENTKEGKIWTFFNHEVVGARIAKRVADRLRLSKREAQRVFTLVRWHMFVYDRHMTDAYIRRFIRRVGIENIPDMLALREADRVGSGSNRTSWRLEELKERVEGQLHQPFSIRDMVVDGEDVMRSLRIKAGPKIGQILKTLFQEVLDDPSKNTREYLLGMIEKLGKK
ncbi:MAG: hypothetical protein A2378_02920 [Candidatus Pacebacteria bacterium RIFOXYB1_FULL_44_10]|nr:MAG: hypothetical protein A2378_02920 [Candidatus Pacebacteria bacterium RIFOXYB1_FULL_44_10]